MSALTDLINQVSEPVLRDRLMKEAARIKSRKRFGLVFEEHIPEYTPLYDVPVKVGGLVAKKSEPVNDIYKVLSVTYSHRLCFA